MARLTIADKYSDEELLKRLKEAESYKDFLEGLGYKNGRAQHTRNVVERRFISMGVNYRELIKPKHIHGALATRIPDDEYYVRGTYRGSSLSRRVRKDNTVAYICESCGNEGSWMGKPMTLELDHIDGDNRNNELSNLRYLCPNCHSQTPTYCVKNIDAGVSQLAEESDLESVQ